MKYANRTEVSPEKSRMHIERILTIYGATGFMYGWQGDQALIAFQFEKKQIKFILPIPVSDDFNTKNQHEQAIRSAWRSLLLLIKAKLEGVESGIRIFEQEFMSDIVMPNGQTFSEYVLPQLDKAIENGKMPNLMLAQ